MWCIASGFCGEELNSLIELRRSAGSSCRFATSVALRQPQTERKNGSKNVCVSRFCNANRQEATNERTKKKDKTWLAVTGREGLAYDGESIENKSTLSTKT
jgi:hypothetical protein